jgi:hypothetical protein
MPRNIRWLITKLINSAGLGLNHPDGVAGEGMDAKSRRMGTAGLEPATSRV